ncbi:hypothetical protein ACJX0J_024620, partial [Zea mays]
DHVQQSYFGSVVVFLCFHGGTLPFVHYMPQDIIQKLLHPKVFLVILLIDNMLNVNSTQYAVCVVFYPMQSLAFEHLIYYAFACQIGDGLHIYCLRNYIFLLLIVK